MRRLAGKGWVFGIKLRPGAFSALSSIPAAYLRGRVIPLGEFLGDDGDQLARVIGRYRLHEAAARLKSDAPPSLGDLAASLGYADQSHFARDFRSVVGRTPRDFAREGQEEPSMEHRDQDPIESDRIFLVGARSTVRGRAFR